MSARLPGALAPMIAERRWLVWRWEERDGRRTKVPYRAEDPSRHARSNDPATWGEHAAAVAAVAAGLADGIGYALASGVVAAFDLDDALDAAGEPLPWASDLIRDCGSYTERTVGGNGLRILGFAEGSKVHRKFKVPGTASSVEAYRQAERYIVVTGAALEGYGGELRNIDSAMDALVARLDLGRKASTASTADPAKPKTPRPCDGSDLPPALFALIRDGVPAPGRSEKFFYAVGALKALGYDVDDVEELFTCFLTGIAEKFEHRLRAEIERAFGKTAGPRDAGEWFDHEAAREACANTKPSGPRLVWYGDREAEPPPWLVKGLVPQAQTAIIAGVYSAGKTFVVGDLAVSVMLAQPFAGHEVERPGAVLWLAAEGANEIDSRIKAAAEARATAGQSGSLPFARQALDVPKLTGPNAETEILDLVSEFQAGLAERFPGVDLVMIVVDTLGSAAGFLDGNNPSEAQRVMNLLRRINVATGALMMLVDHFGKAVETGVMGASSKAQSADVVLAVLCDKNTEGDIDNRRMAVHKLRAGGGGATVPFRLRAVPVGTMGGTTCVVEWSAPDVAASASKPKGTSKPAWSGKARLLRDAIVVATIEHGQPKRLSDADDVEVRAADRERVRATFYAHYTADSAEAKRRAFNRMIDTAQADRLIGVREIGGSDWLWLTDAVTDRDSGTGQQPL